MAPANRPSSTRSRAGRGAGPWSQARFCLKGKASTAWRRINGCSVGSRWCRKARTFSPNSRSMKTLGWCVRRRTRLVAISSEFPMCSSSFPGWRSGALVMAPLRQPGKELEHIGNSEDMATSRVLRRTHQPKVFIDREFGENVLAFRHQREPTLHPLMRRQAVDALPFKQNLACDHGPAPRPARERVDEGRFAGAIGTYQ